MTSRINGRCRGRGHGKVAGALASGLIAVSALVTPCAAWAQRTDIVIGTNEGTCGNSIRRLHQDVLRGHDVGDQLPKELNTDWWTNEYIVFNVDTQSAERG